MYSTCMSGQKFLDAEIAKQSFLFPKKSQKVNNVEIILSEVTTLCINHIIKLCAKAWDTRHLLSQKPSTIKQNLEIGNLIV